MEKMKNVPLLLFYQAPVKAELCLFRLYGKEPLLQAYLQKKHHKKPLQQFIGLHSIEIFIGVHLLPPKPRFPRFFYRIGMK